MTILDLIVIGVIVFFIVTRFTSNPLSKEEKDKNKSIEIKVIKGNAQTKEQIEKIFKKAREMSEQKINIKDNLDDLEGLEKLKAYDSYFTEKNFLTGAKKAYKYVYDLINKDDEKSLEEIVSPRVYGEFVEMLNEFDEKNEIARFSVKLIEDPEILEYRTVAKTAFIDVKYTVKEEIKVTNKETSEVVSQEENTLNVIWTWARNMTSTDPNWQLEGISDAK